MQKSGTKQTTITVWEPKQKEECRVIRPQIRLNSEDSNSSPFHSYLGMTVKRLWVLTLRLQKILASRQLHKIHKYSVPEQLESTATYFETNKDDRKAIHLVVTFKITKFFKLNWRNFHKMKIL